MDEFLSSTTTWMDLGLIMLNKISPAEKDKYFMFSFTWNLNKNGDLSWS